MNPKAVNVSRIFLTENDVILGLFKIAFQEDQRRELEDALIMAEQCKSFHFYKSSDVMAFFPEVSGLDEVYDILAAAGFVKFVKN